jgi:hypothetical protein
MTYDPAAFGWRKQYTRRYSLGGYYESHEELLGA